MSNKLKNCENVKEFTAIAMGGDLSLYDEDENLIMPDNDVYLIPNKCPICGSMNHQITIKERMLISKNMPECRVSAYCLSCEDYWLMPLIKSVVFVEICRMLLYRHKCLSYSSYLNA